LPLYEYLCTKCKHRFEKIQKFSDRMVKKCPECGGKVENVLHAPAVQFKGAGWYVTDYAKKSSVESKDNAAKSDNKSPAEAKPAGDTKSAAKETSESSPKAKKGDKKSS
jgi:putative FmdB family regulatory protein